MAIKHRDASVMGPLMDEEYSLKQNIIVQHEVMWCAESVDKNIISIYYNIISININKLTV